jgi:hypothetical protein
VWEYIWGTISSLGAFAEGIQKVLNYPLFHLYKFMALAGRKTKTQKTGHVFDLDSLNLDFFAKVNAKKGKKR